MSQNPMDREEVESLLATHQELGPAMEPALVDSFAAKIVAEVQRQTQMQQQNQYQMQQRREKSSGGQLALGIVSLVMAIPLTAIALGTGFAWMAALTWVAIVLVNFAYAFGQRREP